MADVLPLRIFPTAADPPADAAAPLVVDARRLAPMLCMGVRTVRTWDAAGKLPSPLRISGKVVWLVSEIHDWLRSGAPCRQDWAAIVAARK